MKCVGLFAGIGGIELGMHSAGFMSELFCEILPEAQAVLRKHFPGVDIVSDARSLRSIPKDTDLICAGFPCQDLSSSGRKQGISGVSSSLVGEVFRLLEQKRCDWVLLENVKFMLHLNGGQAMTDIIKALEELGYSWAYRVMNSQNFGVPQRRERVYFLASRNMRPAGVLFREPVDSPQVIHKPVNTSNVIGFYWTEGTYATGLADDALPPLKAGSTIGIPSAPAIMTPAGLVGTPDIRDAERIQGFTENWTLAAEEIVKPSLRWKLIGNAVTVNVCKWIAEGLKSPSNFDPKNVHLHSSNKWPEAAYGQDGKMWRVDGAYGPFNHSSLSAFLNHPIKPLSHRAVTGFLGRALKGNLVYPEGFIEALMRYARTL